MDYKSILKSIIAGTDLDWVLDNDAMLDYVLGVATSDIERRTGETITDKYMYNVIEGAKWYLARIGVEGETSHTENGVTRTFASISNPPWLANIVPHVTLRKNGA